MPEAQDNNGSGPSADKAAKQAELRDEVIDRLYEVAIDPMRYEDLLDRWESLIGPIRRGANGKLLNDDISPEFASHFKRAGKFLEHLSEEKIEAPDDNPLKTIEKTAAFLVDRNLILKDVNKAGISVLKIAKGDHLGNLPVEKEDLDVFCTKIKQMLSRNSDMASIFRARMTKNHRLIIFQLRSLHPKDSEPVVIAVTSELSWPDGFDGLLKSAFSLTAAEAGVVRGLTECLSLKEIAESRHRSIETVRAQMRSILGKTETRSQTELVRLTLSMMDITTYTENHAAKARPLSEGFETLSPRPFYELTLPDGRKLEYLRLGCQTGRPLIYMPLDYGLTRWPASAEAEAEARKIKVIVPIRAGYGNSTPLPRKTDLGITIARDIATLMDHLQIERAPVLSLGSDVFYTAHLHRQYPGRVSAVIACAGTLPLSRSE